MKKELVDVVFDRKKEVEKCGYGKVEIRIYLGKGIRKYVTVSSCDPFEWARYQTSVELQTQVLIYKHVVNSVLTKGEDLTIDNINKHIGKDKAKSKEERKIQSMKSSRTGFIDFMEECIKKEKLAVGTQKRKKVTIDAMKRYGKLSSFKDLTPENIRAFDEFLIAETKRERISLHNYHKNVKQYTRLAFQLGYIPKDPYQNPLCKFERGKCKERRPLNEDELIAIRNLDDLTPKEIHARDLFIFCAYTGLSYADSQLFDYRTMTEQLNGKTYIDGKRVKTGNNYFTPILPPAMEILEKYGYRLPKLSNQKANDYLHLIESRLKCNKSLTMHVARHSFATLALSFDIPIENVARMLGHSNIKTTQIYAHVLHSTIARHVEAFTAKIR